VRLKDPSILITKQKITSAADFNEIGQALYSKEIKDVVVFCDDIDPLVVPDLVKTRMVRGFRFIIVKMPTLWKDEWFEDLALASGATVIDPNGGVSLKQAKMEHLGTVSNITITKDTTFIDGIKDLSSHIAGLELEDTEESKNRAARLNTKTARYYVGALSESALSYRRLKVEDAISASYHALNGGVVAGGGIALLNAIADLPEGDTNLGAKILESALEEPLKRIASNSGHDYMDVVQTRPAGDYGLNTKTGEVVDMFDDGIVDPTVITINAVENAISVAATVLTANAVVTLPRQESMPMPYHGAVQR
jgi:chaperonin GroEL